ncbi:MAG TPA: methylenetetrahydrofolate reductase [NAD(P)H] [Candidatus Hydrogenedentes bacterium]|nr:methylenetetrahydrofolate reductase [NAD(P)H] [Candidatus Hydrogenedentota bacterium]
MNIANLYKQQKLVISFELFPPKKWKGMANLFEHFKELATCNPSFVTCTYGAGGSNRDNTLEVLRWIREDYPDIPMVAHLACLGMGQESLRNYIAQAIERGVSGIVALRGDPPKEGSFTPAPDGFHHANELVALLRAEFPEISVLVAGYPEKHPEAASMDADIDFLKKKVDAGADAVISQLFYDNTDFFQFRERCARAGITVPIVPGILPVTNLTQVKRITKLCGAKLTPKLVQRLERHGEDAEGQFSVGVYYATRQVEELLEQGVPGVHFYVLNKSRAASHICRALTLDRR